MAQDYKESLSAMMDGEANELELRRTLKDADQEDFDTWSRYQVASSIMKGDKDLFLGSDISAAVAQAIQDEPIQKQGMAASTKSWLSFAVAATVTLAVFAGVQFQNTVEGVQPVLQVADTKQDSAPVAAGIEGLSLQAEEGFATVAGQLQVPRVQDQQTVTERAVADSIAADRLNAHIKAHAENSSVNNNEGILTFARDEASHE